MDRHPQIPLPLSDVADPSMDNYLAGSNALACEMVRGFHRTDSAQLYLWGASGTGKSHLLLASHSSALARAERSFYASLKDALVSPAVCEAMHAMDQVALDDVDQVCGDRDWERAVFSLINFSREAGNRLLFAASGPPSQLAWQLPDLASRLSWGPVLQLQPLSDEQCQQALIAAVQARGMQLDAEVAGYVLRRHNRKIGRLLELVALLDRESLAVGRRRITVPFVRNCLALGEAGQ